MSDENADHTKPIRNFINDFQIFFDVIKPCTGKLAEHINELKKFAHVPNVVDTALCITSNWTTICKASILLEENFKALSSASLPINQEPIENASTAPLERPKECSSNGSQAAHLLGTDVEDSEDHGEKQPENNCANNTENINGQSTEKSPEHTPVKEEDTDVKQETGETCDGVSEPKPGVIRLVPLQKLLSTPFKQRLRDLPTALTISDSEEETSARAKGLSTVNNKSQQIFELSDSEEEQTRLTGGQNQTKPTQNERNDKSSEKQPRIKITPVRSPEEKLSQKKTKRKRSTESSDENDAKSSKNDSNKENHIESSTIISAEEKTPEKNTVKRKNSDDIAAANSDKISGEDSSDKNGVIHHSTPCSSSSSTEPLATKLSTNVQTRLPKSKNDHFKHKCVVRLKRSSLLTANCTQLDKNNQKNSRVASETIKENKKKFKTMASDSDSEKDLLEELEKSDEENSSSSDSEIIVQRKKRVFKKGEEDSSDSSEENTKRRNKPGSTAGRKKRKILNKSNSSDASDGSDDDEDDDDKNKKRKKIRKLINEKNLEDGTKRATKEEEERKKRIEERQKMYNKIYTTPENVEINELILDFDESTKKPLLKVDDGLLKKLKPHQVNGVKFMWDACFETIKDCQEKPGSGCILAHCMGLGKTMQIVTLAHTLLTNYEATHIERVLIISPLSTLNNWAREFYHWINFAKNKNVEIYDMSKFKDKNTRVFKLDEWFNEGGVCIVGYDMYRILSNEKTKGMRKKQKESLQKSLVDPGPDVVVCDEGHLLKNEKTSLSQAVTKMRTKRRIVLTGTPLQNNLKEYYCMIQFIKPNLLGTYKEYLNRFVNPIMNGQYTDSTARDIRLMKHRSHILHKMLEACIQRRDYSVLAPYLPPKHEYVVFVTLSDVQKKLYGHYMTTQREIIGESSGNPGKGAKLFQDFQDLRRIWTHPMNLRMNSDTVIRKKLAQYDSEESMKDFIDDSDDSTSMDSDSSSVAEVRKTKTRAQGEPSDHDSDCVETEVKDDPSEWWTKFVDEAELNNIHHSPKLVLLMTLLQRCEEIGDKVLVFSQSLQSLDVIEHFLSMIDCKTRGQEIEGDVGNFKGYWRAGIDYFRLDGSRSVENRESMCKIFNNTSNLRARLFLISTRAGGLGINLVAANRVVIFDVSWNPSHDTQSIFRVYRFGQNKPCYIYRLIAFGTMEQKVYERQVAKQATAKRVIDEQQISRHYNQSDLQELYSYELEPTTQREIPILPKDRLFAELLSTYEKLLFKYHEHDSLLENEDSENLTEEERKAAWDEYEAEKTRPPQPAMQYLPYDRQAFLANYGNPTGTVTSNKIFGFRSDILLRLLNMKASQDRPELTTAQVIQLVPEYLQRLYSEMNNGDPTLYKELLELHKSLEAPGGMYMNPLLFANQTPAPAYSFGQYGQAHPGTSNFNSNEVYEVE